ncbi:Lysosomal alpha-glucosidase [Holothuria leucospilota]|uniref:Lysosomal alpha-glucosidase n=1 Tax=Holothuria leucospilota TaxID=206669 RepID=A0A9Q1BMK1_HOLLE|nr:Lysosomal alpha-glucosidase [Holothuria leucospilota]
MPSAQFDIEGSAENTWSNSKVQILLAVIITTVVVTVICVPTTYYLHPDYTDASNPQPIKDCPGTEPETSSESPPVTTPVPTQPPNPDNYRFDCGPDRDGVDQATCESRGCTWSPATTSGPPSCFYPEDYTTYYFDNEDFFNQPWGHRVELTRRASTPNHFTDGIDTLRLDVELQTKSRLHFKVRLRTEEFVCSV